MIYAYKYRLIIPFLWADFLTWYFGCASHIIPLKLPGSWGLPDPGAARFSGVAIYVQLCSGAVSSMVLSIFAGFPSHWIAVQQFDDVSLSEVSAVW